jgi:iron complex transport system ATP-binding protein
MIQLMGCTFGYAEKSIVSVNEIQLKNGRFVALIGANGSGKTTFLKAISQFKNAQGNVVINGCKSDEFTFEMRAKTIAFISNEFRGYDHLTTREYLELGRFPYTGYLGKLSAKDQALVSRYANELGLEKLLAQATSTLSDGERQRANIARAFIQETPIVLLDEPTSFLDYPSKRQVMQLLASIVKKHNKLILFSTHDIELALEFADQLLVIEQRTKQMKTMPSSISLSDLVQEAFDMD